MGFRVQTPESGLYRGFYLGTTIAVIQGGCYRRSLDYKAHLMARHGSSSLYMSANASYWDADHAAPPLSTGGSRVKGLEFTLYSVGVGVSDLGLRFSFREGCIAWELLESFQGLFGSLRQTCTVPIS